MPLETIKVGLTTMKAETVPVNVLFEELCESPSFPLGVMADRFQLLEIDGYYLVIREVIYDHDNCVQEFKCFIDREDAISYMNLFGVEPKEIE